MKKAARIMLSLLLCFIYVLPASASSSLSSDQIKPDNVHEKTIVIDHNIFPITEHIDNSLTITRTYKSDTQTSNKVKSVATTKSLLVALGMSEDKVNKLPADTLNSFAESDEISVSVSYSRFNAASNELTYLSKEVALDAASDLSAQQYEYFFNRKNQPISEISPYGSMPNQSNENGKFLDSYMEITHTVSHQGSGKFLFVTDATWLTMPLFRSYDSIGSCAMDCTVTPNTAKGNISYDMAYVMAGHNTTYGSDSEPITDIQTKTTNGWAGVAGIFDMPDNVVTDSVGGVDIIFSNVHAHIEYTGHTVSPGEPRWFNSIATYDHSIFNLSTTYPSIGINFKGDVAASIGIALSKSTDTRNAVLEKYYPG